MPALQHSPPAHSAPPQATHARPAAVLRRKCACGGTPGPTGECEECRRKRLQRSAAAPGPAVAPPVVHDVLASPGRPLDGAVRAEMEPRFRHSFADVRVHADGRAAESARAVGAHAYAVGPSLVFGAGRYAPGSAEGRRLIAHELAHVVQQHGSASASLQPMLEIGAADDPAEREADAAADAALRGVAAPVSPRAGAALRRAVSASIIESPLKNAGACVVHLHGNEATAQQTAITLRQTHCVNLVRLDSSVRNIPVEADVPKHKVGGKEVPARKVTCSADPNRIFTPKGIEEHAFKDICAETDPVVLKALQDELRSWRDAKLVLAIGRCRGGTGGLKSGTLPVLAMHNNDPGGLSIGSYEKSKTTKKNSEEGATERNPARVGGTPKRPNPFKAPGQDPDDFLLATETQDYDFLAAHGRNVVLQARAAPLAGGGTSPGPTDDGSLSVELADARYINVESEGKPFKSRSSHAFVQSRSQALDALQSFGVGMQPCPVPGATKTPASTGTGPGTPGGTPVQAPATTPPTTTPPATNPPTTNPPTTAPTTTAPTTTAPTTNPPTTPAPSTPAPTTVGPRAFDPNAPGMPALKARETTVPKGIDAACWFNDQAALDARKKHWAGVIAGMTTAQVVMWILGLSPPPSAVQSEVKQHQDCLQKRLEAVSNPKLGAAAVKTPPTKFEQSPYRSYQEQETIWETKFAYTRKKEWDRVSDRAVKLCPSLKLGDKWRKTDKDQEKCWKTVMDDDQRQQEILEASSAPGTSRHHWGTDVDILDPDMNPALWKAGTTYDDAYAWIAANAGSYGYIQVYTPMQAGGTGFMEERWHWSYYPVAQALLEFARAHQAEIEAELTVQWGGRPQYSYIQKHWREYMFNVNQAGVF
jgi:hypothetical protein